MTEGHDVGAILEGLRAEVRARRLAQGRSEPGPVERDLRRSLDEIELYRVVSAHWPLLGKTLPQRAIALLNKLVRRYLRWYINPIVEQQNAYNDAVARALRLLAEAYAELDGGQNQEPRTKNQEPRAEPPDPVRPALRGGPTEPRTKNQEPRAEPPDPVRPALRGGPTEPRTKDQEPGPQPPEPVRPALCGSPADGERGREGENKPRPTSGGQRTTDDGQFTQHATRNTQHATQTTDNRQPTNAELMALVRERAAEEPAARFPELELRALEPHLRLRERVSAHWPLPGKSLPQRAIALLNKLVRRYLRWYINPIVEQQNAANAAFSAALLNLIRLDAARRAEVAAIRARAARGGEGEKRRGGEEERGRGD